MNSGKIVAGRDGTGGRDGTSKVLQEVLADLKIFFSSTNYFQIVRLQCGLSFSTARLRDPLERERGGGNQFKNSIGTMSRFLATEMRSAVRILTTK